MRQYIDTFPAETHPLLEQLQQDPLNEDIVKVIGDVLLQCEHIGGELFSLNKANEEIRRQSMEGTIKPELQAQREQIKDRIKAIERSIDSSYRAHMKKSRNFTRVHLPRNAIGIVDSLKIDYQTLVSLRAKMDSLRDFIDPQFIGKIDITQIEEAAASSYVCSRNVEAERLSFSPTIWGEFQPQVLKVKGYKVKSLQKYMQSPLFERVAHLELNEGKTRTSKQKDSVLAPFRDGGTIEALRGFYNPEANVGHLVDLPFAQNLLLLKAWMSTSTYRFQSVEAKDAIQVIKRLPPQLVEFHGLLDGIYELTKSAPLEDFLKAIEEAKERGTEIHWDHPGLGDGTARIPKKSLWQRTLALARQQNRASLE